MLSNVIWGKKNIFFEQIDHC